MEKLLEKFNLTSKKGIENLVIFLVLVIIVMVVMNSLFKEEETSNAVSPVSNVSSNVKSDSLESKLEKILSSIKGVGKVSVMISYTNSIEKIPLYDTKEVTTVTEESDSAGGERKTKEVSNEYKVIYEESNNNKTAIIKQSIMPTIVGVIVTAEGAENNVIKENILNAVIAVTNVPSHKIQVFAQ